MSYLNAMGVVLCNSQVSGGRTSNSPVGTEGSKEYTNKKPIPNNVVNIEYYPGKEFPENNFQINYEYNSNFTIDDRNMLENFLNQLVNKFND